MKRIILIIMAVILMFGIGIMGSHAEEINKIEISFAIGDSVIKINDTEVPVVKPYVVNGVTLVPVRVISESFGADVSWNEQTEEVTISYCDLTIKLTIGSNIAYLNDNETELLSAPELTDGSTMLPLRFISESFGADVNYDDETALITIVKEITESNSIRDYAAVLKRSSKELIGDSHLKWSIKRPAEFKLSRRTLDGRRNMFVSDTRDAYYSIVIFNADPDIDIDDRMDFYREYVKDYTAIDLGKKTSPSGFAYAHAQFKDSSSYNDFRTYFADDYNYIITLHVNSEYGISEFNSLCDVIDSFDIKFDAKTSEDLTDIGEDGMHTFVCSDYNLKISIPASFLSTESENKDNIFKFYNYPEKDLTEHIYVGVFSNNKDHTMQMWLDIDYKNNKKELNPDFSEFSEINDMTVDGKPAKYYTYTIKKEKQTITKDIFVDAGPYFYNIAIELKHDDNWESRSQKIIDSILIGDIDEGALDKIIRTETDDIRYKTVENDAFKYSLDIPSTWEVKVSGPGINCADYDSVRFVNATYYPEKISKNQFLSDIKDMYKNAAQQNNIEMISSQTEKKSYKEHDVHYYIYKADLGNGMNEICISGFIYTKEALYSIVVSCAEIGYGEKTKEIFDTIFGSFKIIE